jgi:hypothetical protein
VDVTGIGAPGTPTALLWHEIAARHGLICPYGPHNPVEWNHCQPTWVKIVLAENPLRETVTADGPISLEGMFEAGYPLIGASGTVHGSTADLPVNFFKRPQARTAMPAVPRTISATDRKILRQARLNIKVPISAELAKTCRAQAITAHPTQRAGSRAGSAQAQRDYFQKCVAKRSQKLAQSS